MRFDTPSTWANAFQFVFAGFGLSLCVQHSAASRWTGRRSQTAAVAWTAGALSAVLTSNGILLACLPTRHLTALLFLRTLALSALMLCIPRLAMSLGARRSRWLARALFVTVAVRLALWPGTNLVYAHRTQAGLPVYGVLAGITGTAAILALSGYVVLIVLRARPGTERAVLLAGLVLSLTLAALSLLVQSAMTAELLTGYLTLPVLAALASVAWSRQRAVVATARRLMVRERALKRVTQAALEAPIEDVERAAHVALREDAGECIPVDDRPATARRGFRRPRSARAPMDPDFADAVQNVVRTAAAAHRATTELREQSATDELTKLPNRAHVQVLLDALLRRPGAVDTSVVVAVCNIDRFNTVNDAFGYEVGNEVLREIARRLRDCAKACDIVGRLGDDEFVVICSGSSRDTKDTVDDLVGRIHDCFGDLVTTPEARVRVVTSVGVCTVEPSNYTARAVDLLRDAVTAMHDAKSRGSTTRKFDDSLRRAVVVRAGVEVQLVDAIENDEIVVHYQPIVELPDSATVGFEALARWRHNGELIPPADWIPVAESTGLIHEIGAHVMLTAARQTAQWHAIGYDVSINVNVSARQLVDSRFPQAVLEALDLIPAHQLFLEITESLALDELAHETLTRLRRVGLRTSLDDFGTGYSALAALARLPIDQLKIDREITSRVDLADGQALLQAVLAVAATLGLSVLAEGVETPHQHHALAALGCHNAQGFFYSKPMAARDATSWLRHQYVSTPGRRPSGAPAPERIAGIRPAVPDH